MKKKLFGVLMAMTLCLGMLPTAWADEKTAAEPVSDAAIYDVSELSKHCNPDSVTNPFYYGNMECYVIACGGDGVRTSENRQATLITRNTQGGTLFGENKNYAESYLRKRMDDLAADSRFSEIERAAIVPRTLDDVADADVENAMLWPLSIDEANKLAKLLRTPNNTDWWLRSPGGNEHVPLAAYMSKESREPNTSNGGFINSFGVRPAFNIDLNEALFLTKVYRSESFDYDWSFTLLDSSRKFSAATTGRLRPKTTRRSLLLPIPVRRSASRYPS